MWKAFVPRPSDVIITTFPKSGTTWMQQIAHTLRTGGDMSFDEITSVVPWLEIAHSMGIDLDAPHAAEPRVFKSHLAADEIPVGARYVCAVRHPADVLKSYYNFMSGWFFEHGSVSIEDYAQATFFNAEGSDNYWHHFVSWWNRRGDEDVVLLCYEDMQAAPETAIRRIAEHCGIDLTPELLQLTLKHSSHAFMKQHASQFDENATKTALDEICGLPPGGESSKVGHQAPALKALPPAMLEQIEQAWRDQVTGRTGIANYADFRAALAR